MKNATSYLVAGLLAGLFATTALAAPPQDDPAAAAAAEARLRAARAAEESGQPAQTAQPAAATDQTAVAQTGDQTNTVAGDTTNAMPAIVQATVPAAVSTNGASIKGTADQGLTFNIRGMYLDNVLNLLAESVGWVVIRNASTQVPGTVDMVSDKPLNRDETVALLNDVLAKNGLAAQLSGKDLTIMTTAEARTMSGTQVSLYQDDPTNVPQDSVVVSEIIPLHSLNPTQLLKDLTPLKPLDASLVASDGGNAIVMTARRADIRRFLEIIHALDGSTMGALEVYMLTYADSKSVAQELKDVFTDTGGGGGGANPFGALFGGGGRGGRGGGGGGAAGGGAEDSRRAAIHVNAVSDDENNAVLVSAPADYIPGISNIIKQLDIPQEDTVVIRVFMLTNADPTDIANQLAALYPDPTTQQNQGNTRGRGAAVFGGARGGAGGGGTAASGLSERAKKQATVNAVPDPRTESVIVTASTSTMEQIAAMITELDENPARQMHVYTYQPTNAYVLDLVGPIQDLFGSAQRTSSTSQLTNPLTLRQTQAQQQNSLTTTTMGSTGGGGGGGALR